MRRLALLALVAASMHAAEIRGAWIARNSLNSRESIRQTMRNLAEANFNTAYVLAWSQGYPLFHSKVFEAETGLLTDPAYGARDVLAEAVEEAAAAGLTVIPWFEYGFAGVWSGRLTPGSNGPLFDRHPDWLARNRAGDARFPIPGGTYYYWLVHTHPEVQNFLMRLMDEAAQNYNVPGVQFDRARYPDLDCGYDEFTRRLYAAEHDGLQPPDNPRDAGWIRWRADKLSDFLLRARSHLRNTNWRVLFTNAPVPTPDGYGNFAQDPPAWVRDGSHDFLSPQIYWRDPATFQAKLELHIRLYGDASRLVPGIAVDTANPSSLIQIIESIRRANLPGVVIWYYEDLRASGALLILKESVFLEKAVLPWK
jgi:uncharacterized lipoprotein YddW (UPF0748 family)